METSEFGDITEKLYKKLEALSLKVVDAQAAATKKEDFLYESHEHDTTDRLSDLVEISGSISKNLEKVLKEQDREIIDCPENELHVCLLLLEEFDAQCKQQENLIKKRRLQIEEIRNNTKKVQEHKKLMENCIKARETTGELVELRGYTPDEIESMAKQIKIHFETHKKRLMEVIIKLFPDNHEEISELLALLTKHVFEKTGTEYLDIKSYPDLQTAATYLLCTSVIARHPNRSNLIQLCILD